MIGSDLRATDRTIEIERRKKLFRCNEHNHTTASDGFLSVAQLIDFHWRLGFAELVITDHDFETLRKGEAKTMRARHYAQLMGIKISSGVEFSCYLDVGALGFARKNLTVHLTGRDFDSDDPEVRKLLDWSRIIREARVRSVLEKIRVLDPDLRLPEIIVKKDGVMTTTDIALAIGGLNQELDVRAFLLGKLTGDRRYYVPQEKARASDMIAIIGKTGRTAWAHPVKTLGKDFDRFEEVADILVAMGLQGIEAFAPGQDAAQIARIVRYCLRSGLEVCFGADTHIAEHLMRYKEMLEECLKNPELMALVDMI